MKKIKEKIVVQRAIKYNKIVRRIAHDTSLYAQYALDQAETALEKALLEVSVYGYIGIIWTGSIIDQIIIADNVLEVM